MHYFSFFVFIGFNGHLGAKCNILFTDEAFTRLFLGYRLLVHSRFVAKALSHCQAILRYMSIVATFEAQYAPSLACIFCVHSLLEWFKAKWGILLGPHFPTSLAFYFVLI